MNMESPEKLAGSIKPGNIPVGFCIPVYSSGQDYFIQEPGEGGRPEGFKKINDDVGTLIEYVEERKYNYENENLYAFLNQDGSVHYDSKCKMQKYLRQKLKELDDYVFVKLEVLEFLEDFDAVPSVVIEAASLMLEDNPKGALAWAKMKSEKAAVEISRKIDKKNKKINVGITLGEKANHFERLKAEDLSFREFEHSYIDVADWQPHGAITQSFVVGRRGGGKSSLLRMAKARSHFSDLVFVEPKIVDVVTSINNFFEKKEEINFLKYELIWRGVIAGIICQEVIDSDNWAELSTNPIFSEQTKLKCIAYTPDYIKSKVNMIGIKNPLISSFMKLALSLHSSSYNYLTNEFEYIISSNLEKKNRKLMLIIDGLEGSRPHSTTNNSIQGIMNYILRQGAEQSKYAFIASLPLQSYLNLLENSPNRLPKILNITWNASELRQMIFRRLELMSDKEVMGEIQKHPDHKVMFLLRSALLQTFYNTRLHLNESGINYLIRHTQFLPRQLIYILSKLYQNSTTLLHEGLLPSRSNIDAAIYEAAPILAREAVQEVADNTYEFLYALEILISRVGTTFKFSDVAKEWDNERYLKEYFSSPVQACEQLTKVGAIGRVVKRAKSFTAASFSVSSHEPFSESEDQYCFHPLFLVATKRTRRLNEILDENIIPIDYFELDNSG